MRYSFAPVDAHRGEMSLVDLAQAVDYRPNTLQRWRQMGMDEAKADACAVAIGMSPYELWPEMLDHAITKAEQVCPQCDERFIPQRKGTVFCSVRCRRRAAQIRGREQARRRYAEDAEYRAHKQAQAKARRESARRADAIAKREWYRRNRDVALEKRRARYRANAEAEKARQAAYRARKRAA